MNFSTFHAGVAMTLLAVASTAQAATPRSEIARPTDYTAVAADRSIGGCESTRLAVCGRQVAGKLKWPAGVAGRDAYRFAEEEFLFDSGVGIFLQTAVSAQKGAAVEWRRRLAFKRTPAGSFQLVQVGMQYRCGSGSWQKTVCTVPKPAAPANVAKAAPGKPEQQPATQGAAADVRQGVNAAQGAPERQAAAGQTGRAGAADAAQGIDAGARAAGASATGRGAEQVADAMGDANRAAADAGASATDQGAGMAAGAGDAGRTAANTGAQVARESASAASRAAGGASAAAGAAASGAAAAGQQGAASSGQTQNAESGSALYPREETAPQGGLDARWRPRSQPEGAQQDPEERARQAAQRAVTGGDAGNQEGVDQMPAPGQEGNTRRSAEIVAASPSVRADQLRALREDEELANQSSGAMTDDLDAAPGSQRAGQAADARRGASGEGAPTGESGQRQQMASAATTLTPTAPQSVRSAKGFRQVVLRPEQLNRLGRLCEQPIDLCGQKVFDDMLAPEFFAELSPQQVQRERFIYADGPVVSAVYLVTMADLPDDALSAERVRIEFVRRGSGWVAVSVGRQVRCQKGYNDWTEAHCGG